MKKIPFACALLGFSIIPFQVHAGLTLCSQNVPNKIDIVCNGVKSPAPIPASASITSCASLMGISNLPWISIRALIFKGKTTATCLFNMNNTTLGSAVLTIASNNSTGTLSNVTYDPTQYTVNIDPGVDQASGQIKVLITPAG